MPLLILTTLLSLPSAPGQEACSGEPDWRAVIREHVARYPAMEPQDLYKLLHQGSTGSEHAVESPEAAARWMESEVATLGDGPAEPLADTIAPGGSYVRVHLRPFVAAGGDPAALLSAFVATANAGAPPASRLRCALATAIGLADEGVLPWEPGALKAYFARQRAAGYPAVHHSDAFLTRYRPAYRVVSGDLLRDLLPGAGR